MKTLIRQFSAFIYIIVGLFEPTVLDTASPDEKLSISAKIVKYISASIFVLSFVWGLIAMREIVNYLEITQFLSVFITIGFLTSLLIIFFITRHIQTLKENKGFLFFTFLSGILLIPLSVDYLNKNFTYRKVNSTTYEIINKNTKSNEAMFSWVYLRNSTREIKVNVSKQLFNSLTVKDRVELKIKKGLFDFEFVEAIRKK